MKILFSVLLFIVLVGCDSADMGGNYEIGHYVEVELETKESFEGQLYKVKKKVVILKTPSNVEIIIPRFKIKYMWPSGQTLQEILDYEPLGSRDLNEYDKK